MNHLRLVRKSGAETKTLQRAGRRENVLFEPENVTAIFVSVATARSTRPVMKSRL
jgi:hypothetical protein